jgi:hypothetical protein
MQVMPNVNIGSAVLHFDRTRHLWTITSPRTEPSVAISHVSVGSCQSFSPGTMPNDLDIEPKWTTGITR